MAGDEVSLSQAEVITTRRVDRHIAHTDAGDSWGAG